MPLSMLRSSFLNARMITPAHSQHHARDEGGWVKIVKNVVDASLKGTKGENVVEARFSVG